ncbi:Adenylate cyclase-like protein [Emericellopsis cladophorae]|uniref:Adenylate cyclase n=1 Tax=Emericellopsis cladophorae TaxID=2686198 RepID=A0A9P9Y9A8_9HYPO|nr:Adenylate cyclase-like protein [Emericellopsis cladophorae]KAI6785892.1 Adenylate cyclase-like protein [Emericellopsis cladophorae]
MSESDSQHQRSRSPTTNIAANAATRIRRSADDTRTTRTPTARSTAATTRKGNVPQPLDVNSGGPSLMDRIQYNPPTGGIVPEVAPWMSNSGPGNINGNGFSTPGQTGQSSFYHDSSDGQSVASQISPGQPSSPSHRRPSGSHSELPDAHYSYDRRPSAASIATASSTGSKTSLNRGGMRKLQGFFGEEFPGRDSFDGKSMHKDQQARSFSGSKQSYRGRKASNATSTSQTRDVSPSSSRPRTPVPAPEVVPFLYQDNSDIARYGEAPVRNSLTGLDRDRYLNEGQSQSQSHSQSQIPPKTSSSSRSGHSIAHLPGHRHRHNRSNDDPRALRPTMSREETSISAKAPGATTMARDKARPHATFPTRSRGQSPTSSTSSVAPSGGSPGTHGKMGLLGRLRQHHHNRKDQKEGNGEERHHRNPAATAASKLRSLPQSTKSLQTKSSTTDVGRRRELSPSALPPLGPTMTEESPFSLGAPAIDGHAPSRAGPSRGATFNNKFHFPKMTKSSQRAHEDLDESIGPTDQGQRHPDPGALYHLDTNLNDMEGILTRPPRLEPVDVTFPNDDRRESIASPPPKGRWDAPDSWAVRRNTDDQSNHTTEMEELQSPPRPEEKRAPYCIRIFRSDGTFSTHSMPLDSSVSEVISQVIKKTYVVDGIENYHVILKRGGLIRVLGNNELPLLIQKRLLQQAGYEDKDRIEDVGREDNSYLCRFEFLSSKEGDFHSQATDNVAGNTKQKLSYVNLTKRNLVTIPISLYLRASEIVSLNLSYNLSLDVPRDFIQSCKHLREISFTNNEARRLPLSLGRASKLTMLDVSNNRLDQLEHAELESLTALIKLNLANNRLKALPPYIGAYKMLRHVTVSSNYLDRFPAFLCDLPSLRDLDLSFNNIDTLPEDIGELGNLEKFLITNNRLKAVPDSFADLVNLRELDIKYNAITSINTISELPKLEILYADHNSISAFSGSFYTLRHLKLNSNPLNKFELEQSMPTLKTLNLSTGQLASIDSAFAHVPNLENLILDKNYFVSLPVQIGTLSRLEHFSIANNSVGELPPQIGCLTELRRLDVRGNNISKLPMEIWWAKKLEYLNASSNVLEQFPKAASRPPRVPGEEHSGPPPTVRNGPSLPLGSLSTTPSSEELSDDRRPSQASSTLLSIGPSPASDRKSSVVSVYGKGGRQTSVVSRSGTSSNTATAPLTGRKDSTLSSRMSNTFAGSLRNLSLADNRLDDDVFDQIAYLAELRILNLSYNDEITDMPQRAIKSWPQLVELYLSGNGLTSLPADDLEETSLLQTLFINGNKFTNLPADISRASKLAVLDCGSNQLKYNISNVPYDWNWNLNPQLRYLNLSGNKKLEIKQTIPPTGSTAVATPGMFDVGSLTDFSKLTNLRILGLMDVTLTQPSIPDQSEDRRVRTSGSLAGHLKYGMADTLGRNEHLSAVDLVVPRFNSSETEMLLGLFDGAPLSMGGSKIAKYLHENFGHIFAQELKSLKTEGAETPEDALRRAFLAVNKDLATIGVQRTDDRPRTTQRLHPHSQPLVISKEDLSSGGVATVVYLKGTELYVANVGDAQAMVVKSNNSHVMLTKKHDPAEPTERSRIREAGGWVSRNGRLNDKLEVSRAFGYSDMIPVVQACPWVSQMSIRETDEIIIMATKELWEYLSPELITDIARAERQDLMRAAQKLRDLAMAYGATGKIMVMIISVTDLKRRVERSRTGNRGPSMSLYPSGVPDEFIHRPLKKSKTGVLDSSLNRLEAEIPAPTGTISIVFTDIKNSTMLWEMYPNAMRSAIKLHHEVMRRQLRQIGGYEVKTEGDAFMVSFPTATSALLWCFAVQLSLLEVNWPSEVLTAASAEVIHDNNGSVIFKGLSVRMGIHHGDCVSETDPVTRRMDYFGPMVNKAARVSAVADGGQITVSSDFISEIQRCLENYQDTDRQGSSGSEGYEEEYANSIRKDLRSLTSRGFEVKEMGEKKLKGLENPEVIYSLYPHELAGRIEYHQQIERRDDNPDAVKPQTVRTGQGADLKPEVVWDLWRVSLRLEMLCSTLEEVRGSGLQPPETELIDRLKARSGEISERFLMNFMEHQVSRIEACVTTIAVRYLARCDGPLHELNQLRAPMSAVLDFFVQQKKELERYRALYGDLPPDHAITNDDGNVDDDDDTEGSSTAQE